MIHEERLFGDEVPSPALRDPAAIWAERIRERWQDSVEAIFDVGRLLVRAKGELEHGAWEQMCDTRLPFNAPAARKLMAIANDERLLNRSRGNVLPPHWTTLYQLTTLDDDALDSAFDDGVIRPDMERGDISARVKAQRRAARERELGAKEPQVPIAEFASSWPQYHGDEALRVGRAAEHLVCADGLMHGWNAFLAGQGTPYDVVFEKDGRLVRLQVKCTQWARNVNAGGRNPREAYSFAALRRGKNGEGPRLSRNDADLFACVALDIGVVAYLPVVDCSSTIQLVGGEIAENGYNRSYEHPIQDYPLERAIARLDAEPHYVQLKQRFAAFPKRAFRLIYADPPWSFETWSTKGMDRSADNHYPTVDADLLCGIGPYIPAANDAVLFLWATSPMLVEAFRVMAAWGFNYKTSFVWKKDRPGTGFWFRNQHETLLLGTKGSVPAPAPGTQEDSIIEAPVTRHSEKPQVFYGLIERMFPSFSKLEMFCRGPARPGWEAWGLEASDQKEKSREIDNMDGHNETPSVL
jgi:N6-adenosine-specific RNA methylase IME4